MISDQKRFLFIHIPKTAGNSIQNILRDYSEDNIIVNYEHQDGIERFGVNNKKYRLSKHSFLSQCKTNIDSTVYNSLFKFATIRNPWDRMVSLYFSPAQGRTEWNRPEFLELIQNAVALRYFIRENLILNNDQDESDPKQIIDNLPLDHDIDFLIRFERLNEDFEQVCEKLDIPHKPLPIRNISGHTHYSEYYDEDLKELVSQRFKDEIAFGDYHFEDC